jgi:hypothetical protein
MHCASRHQCLIYDGHPSLHLRSVARVARDQLKQNRRCLYLNSRTMVAGMRVSLEAAGVNVTGEVESTRLILQSEQRHLVGGVFDVKRMIGSLEESLNRALRDGYAGLWATGDMSWEMGPDTNPEKLLEYEWQLEQFLGSHPEMSGICQYHSATLSHESVRLGFVTHSSIFIDEKESRHNPHFVRPGGRIQEAALAPENAALDAAMRQLCSHGGIA